MFRVFILISAVFMTSRSQKAGDVRLVNGDADYQGRLEYFYNQQWRTVCADGWGYLNSKVVCTQLGLPSQGALFIGEAYFGKGSGPILLQNLVCEGTEKRIADCVQGIRQSDCQHSHVSIVCSVISDVRLYGTAPSMGRVEAYYGGTWIPVCYRSEEHEAWNNEAVRVVCSQLGYEAGGIVNIQLAEGLGLSSLVPYTVNNVQCDYSRNTLRACSYEVETHKCLDNVQATALCFENNAGVRLVDGDSYNQGRLEVYYNDQWGTVCDTYWSKNDAEVVCRQLGLPYGAVIALDGAYFGRGVGTVWLDGLQCNGKEDGIATCDHQGWKEQECGHEQDASLICSGCSKSEQLGLESGAIADAQITSTPAYGGYEAYRGRLRQSNYWTAQPTPDPYIQVEFLTAAVLMKILIQGSGNPEYNAWVQEVEVQFGYSKDTLNYIWEDNERMRLTANKDLDTVVELPLPVPITAHFLRINPVKCNNYCALRFDVVGCPVLNECQDGDGPCDVHAICSDLQDGFKCTCKPGFVGNGYQCTEIVTSTDDQEILSHTFVPGIGMNTSSNNRATIIGCLVGGLLLVTLFILLLWFIFRYRNRGTPKATALELTEPQNDQQPAQDTQADLLMGNIYQGISDPPNGSTDFNEVQHYATSGHEHDDPPNEYADTDLIQVQHYAMSGNEYANTDLNQVQHYATSGHGDNPYACPDQMRTNLQDNPNTVESTYADIDHGHVNCYDNPPTSPKYAKVNKNKTQPNSIQINPDSNNHGHTLPKQDQCNRLQSNPHERQYYTYVETPNDDSHTPGKSLASSKEGWLDNSLYNTSNEDATPTKKGHVTKVAEPVTMGNQYNEGWEDNSLYGTSGGSDDIQQQPISTQQVDGWIDNSIYDVK